MLAIFPGAEMFKLA